MLSTFVHAGALWTSRNPTTCMQMPSSLGGDLRGLKGHDVAEPRELLDEPAGLSLTVSGEEPVLPELVVGEAAGEHVVGGDEDRVADGRQPPSWLPGGPSISRTASRGRCLSSCLRRGRPAPGRPGATSNPCGSGPSDACRRTRRCQGTSRPTRRGGDGWGTGSCPCRSPRGATPPFGHRPPGWCEATPPSR